MKFPSRATLMYLSAATVVSVGAAFGIGKCLENSSDVRDKIEEQGVCFTPPLGHNSDEENYRLTVERSAKIRRIFIEQGGSSTENVNTDGE